MTSPQHDRQAYVLSGLILGETLTWTGMFERSMLLPFWTRRKHRELEAQHDDDGLLELPLPFSLNVLPAPLYPGPGAHAEWFIFQAQLLTEQTTSETLADRTLRRWRSLTEDIPAEDKTAPRLTLSQHAATRNLRAGATPPETGHDNPHYFDDGACFRALAIACFFTDEPSAGLGAVDFDASLTNAEDGVWAARAVAAFALGEGATCDERCARALRELPTDSWIGREAKAARDCAGLSSSVFDLAVRLSNNLTSYAYSYGNAAPETVSAALAILAFTDGNPERALLAALGVPRLAGSLVPLVGALCGALAGATVYPGTLEHPIAGTALPHLRGHSAAHYLAQLKDMKVRP